MAKIFILDTSAILSFGRKIFTQFDEHEVVIPLVVITELEKKRHDSSLGLTARSALNFLEDLRVNGCTLSSPTPINDKGGTLRIELNNVDQANLPHSLAKSTSNDTKILAVASALQRENPDKDVILISKDLPMRILASTVLRLKAEEPIFDFTPMDDLGTINKFYVNSDNMDSLFARGSIDLDPPKGAHVHSKAVVVNYEKPSTSALVSLRGGVTYSLVRDESAGPVFAKSAEQRFAINDLYNSDISIVSLGGRAGSGKSLLSIVAGIDQVMDPDSSYEKVVIFRPVNTLAGQDIGFLPGEVGEKMEPFAQAVYDTLESVYPKEKVSLFRNRGYIEVQPLTYIRGRTLTNSWVVVDEAQNLEKYIILTALSRIGQNSKVVLDWDVSQRDNLHVGKYDGIYAVVNKLRGYKIFSHTTLVKSERSAVAELVSEVLDEII